MNVGDLYIAGCPYVDRLVSKERLVIVLRVLDDGVAILESRSAIKKHLDMVLEIDFDKRYSHVRKAGHSGTSRFYAENFRVIPMSSFNLKSGKRNRLGALESSDLMEISVRLGFPPRAD